jgi:sirohydrochlorin cobaltochelatase
MAIFTAPHATTRGTSAHLRKAGSTLLLVAHGSTENEDSSAPAWALAQELRRKGIFGEVHCCFWKEEPSLREALYQVQYDDVYIAPLFISEGYFTTQIIPRELELEGPITERDGFTLKYCEPAGSHPAMTELLLLRAREVAPDLDPEQTSLLIVAHGTGLNEESRLAAEFQAKRLQEMSAYAEVRAVYMEEEPRVENWADLALKDNVVIVPFFIADGLHSYQDIPVLLGIEAEPTRAASRMEVFRRNPYRLAGKTLYYSGAIGTHPHMAQVVLDQVASFDQTYGVLLRESGLRSAGIPEIGEPTLAGV